MNQPNEGFEKIKPGSRRSSILAQHVLKEGPIIPGHEILRGLASSLQQNLARHSNNLQVGRSSGIHNSLNPTPLGSRPGLGNSGRKAGSNIPLAVKKFMEPTSSSVAKKKFGIAAVAGRGGLNPSGSTQKTSINNRTVHQASRVIPVRDRFSGFKNSTLRRSNSMDSVAFSAQSKSMLMMTPSVTPGGLIRKSPGTMRRWGSSQDILKDNSHHPKTIKVSNDKKALFVMMQHVHAYLYEQRYPNLPVTVHDIRNISTSTYYNMVYFVGKSLVGEIFFYPKEDIVARIVELSNVLKYPSVISKSHLKSANAPQSFPASLTFLCWLCCRVQAIPKTETRGNPMELEDLRKDDAFLEVALNNFLDLFYWNMTLGNNLSNEERQIALMERTAEELMEFRCKVSDMLMSEINYTLEELNAQKQENQEYLNGLKTKPDPVKEISDILDDKTKKLKVKQNKIIEKEEEIKKFRDLNSLRVKEVGLKLELVSRQADIDYVKQKISCQPFDKQGEKKMLMEIQNLQEQQKCLATILNKLETDLLRKQQAISNLNERFRQTIAQLTVVETFNANLSNLRVDGLSVPVNPLTPEELKDWLEEVEKIHDKTEQVSQALMEAVKRDNSKLEEMEMSTSNAMNSHLHEKEKNISLIEALSIRCEESTARFVSEQKSQESRNSELNDRCIRLKDKLEKQQKNRETKEKMLEQLEALLTKRTNGLKKWQEYVEELEETMSNVESRYIADCEEKCIETLKMLDEITKEKNELLGSAGNGTATTPPQPDR